MQKNKLKVFIITDQQYKNNEYTRTLAARIPPPLNLHILRKLFSILFILLALISCDKSKNDNYYDMALKQATKNDKNILLDFSAIWCGGCRGYDSYVFNDSLIQESLNRKYILLKIDRDKQENKFLIDKYKIQGLPHIVAGDLHWHQPIMAILRILSLLIG